MSEDILYESRGTVRLITINRPAKMNSLDFTANDALVAAFQRFNADSDARVAVLTGAGDKAFCAGADLKTYTMNFGTSPQPSFRETYTNGFGIGGITRGLDIFKPIVAAVNGFAISGGFEIALACDIRFAAPQAEFAIQDVKWGFHPCDGALIRLPYIIGLGNAMEMFLSGDRIDAEHAMRIGLVNRVFPADRLLDEAIAYAAKLASRAPLAQRFGKEVMLRSLGRPPEDGLRYESRSFRDLGDSADIKEGNDSFRERREARFIGR